MPQTFWTEDEVEAHAIAVAALAKANERSECLKIAEASAAAVKHGSCSWGTATEIAEAIKNRT